MTGRHVTCLQFHNPAYSTGIHLHEKKYDAGHLETNFRAGHIQKSCFWPMKIIRTGANTKEREQLLAGLDSAVTPASSWVSACAARQCTHAQPDKAGKSSALTAHAQMLAHTCSTMHPLHECRYLLDGLNFHWEEPILCISQMFKFSKLLVNFKNLARFINMTESPSRDLLKTSSSRPFS